MKKFDIVVVASKLISRQAAQVWGNCDLSDLGSWASGTGFPLEHQGNTDLPYLMCKVSDMNLAGNEIYLRSTVNTLDDTIAQKIGAKIHSKGTVVFPKIGGAIATNKRRILEHPTAIDNNMLGIIPNKDVLSKWLYFLLRGIDFSEFQSGTSVPAVSQKDLGQIKVPTIPIDFQQPIIDFLTELESNPNRKHDLPQLPAPLTEQRRIVAHIESLAARVNEAQRLREEADAEAGAILHSAQNQFIGSEPKPDWVSLRHYVAEIRNGKSPDCEKRPAKLDEWGVLKVGAVSFGKFDEQQNKALPLSITPNPEYEVKTGDFLMIRANTKELVGACAIVEKTRPRLLLSDKTFRFVFREDNIIDQRYLNHVLKSPTLRIQIEAQASGTSPTMKNISKEKVMELKVPCIPLDEQRRIVAYLDGLQAKVNALRGLQSQSQEELDALLPSVLDRAFRGEL